MVSVHTPTTPKFKLLLCEVTEPSWEEVLTMVCLKLSLHTPSVPLGHQLSVNLRKWQDKPSRLIAPTAYEFPPLVT